MDSNTKRDYELCSINSSIYLHDNFNEIREFTFRLLMNIYYSNMKGHLDNDRCDIFDSYLTPRGRRQFVSLMMKDTIVSYLSMSESLRVIPFNITTNTLTKSKDGDKILKSLLIMDDETNIPITFNSAKYSIKEHNFEHLKNLDISVIAENTFPADDQIHRMIRYQQHLNKMVLSLDSGVSIYKSFYEITFEENITIIVFMELSKSYNASHDDIITYNYCDHKIAELVHMGSIPSLKRKAYTLDVISLPMHMNDTLRSLRATDKQALETYLISQLHSEVNRIKESMKRVNNFVVNIGTDQPELIDKNHKLYKELQDPSNLNKSKSSKMEMVLNSGNRLYFGGYDITEVSIYDKKETSFENLRYIIKFRSILTIDYLERDEIKNYFFTYMTNARDYYIIRDIKLNKTIAVSTRLKLALNWIVLLQGDIAMYKK